MKLVCLVVSDLVSYQHRWDFLFVSLVLSCLIQRLFSASN